MSMSPQKGKRSATFSEAIYQLGWQRDPTQAYALSNANEVTLSSTAVPPCHSHRKSSCAQMIYNYMHVNIIIMVRFSGPVYFELGYPFSSYTSFGKSLAIIVHRCHKQYSSFSFNIFRAWSVKHGKWNGE